MLLRPRLTPVNLAMIYLLEVVAVSVRSNRQVSIATALASVAAFDFFCVPPYLTFAVGDPEYLVTFAAMLVVALVISTLTDHIRRQAAEATAREARAQALYCLSDRLAHETRVFEAARVAAAVAADVLAAQVVIFPAKDDAISFQHRTSARLPVPRSEETIAQWVLRHGRQAGLGVDQLLPATALYIPLPGVRSIVGVMAVVPNAAASIDSKEQRILIDLLANHTALAIERTVSQNAAEASRVQMQTEQMRSSLLSAVSHDLRTPLAAITGAASTLRQQRERLSEETRNDLLDSISEEAERLSRLVANLLDMTRFESGGTVLKRDACPLEEIVGTALRRLETQLKGRGVVVDLPPDLPMLYVDEVLAGQVFVNLLENAAKYAPANSPIEISAMTRGEMLEVTLRDHGPGLNPDETDRLFEKFYRGRGQNVQGAGLGLAISKAVVEAHKGTVGVRSVEGQGSEFTIRLLNG